MLMYVMFPAVYVVEWLNKPIPYGGDADWYVWIITPSKLK